LPILMAPLCYNTRWILLVDNCYAQQIKLSFFYDVLKRTYRKNN